MRHGRGLPENRRAIAPETTGALPPVRGQAFDPFLPSFTPVAHAAKARVHFETHRNACALVRALTTGEPWLWVMPPF